MDLQAAVAVAQDALIWLAGQPDAMSRFLAATGADPADLRAGGSDPEFLGFLLDFLMSDEALLLEFCESNSCPPTLPGRARAALPGGDLPNWT